MPNFTAAPLLALRRLLRTSGLATPISALLGRGDYEHRLNSCLRSSVKHGDCVWDVGANVGYYTKQFAALAGQSGKVFAFEPSSINAARLRPITAQFANVATLEVALSERSGSLAFQQGNDDLGATSRLLPPGESSVNHTGVVRTASGQDLIEQGRAAPPNVLKIDVEGHELEVLRGFGDQLLRRELRHVFVEVHFALLDQCGRSDVPGMVVSLLETSGFEVSWIDPSHLHAWRGSIGGEQLRSKT